MAKITKAAITYSTGTGEAKTETTVRFHAVVSEGHDLTTKITSFPAQDGFVVSRHAIIGNRGIQLEGIVTDTPMVGSDTFIKYGLDNKKVLFKTLQELMQNATPCKVETNLGVYEPVIFNKFKTKQNKDHHNSMLFTLKGEEIQDGKSEKGDTPALVTFSKLGDAEKDAHITELKTAGVHVPEGSDIFTAQVDFGSSFSLDTFNPSGDPMTVVYEHLGTDPATLQNTFMVHTSDTFTAISPVAASNLTTIKAVQNFLDGPELPSSSLLAGAAQAASCLGVEGVNDAVDQASGYINTASGYLLQSIYGAAFGISIINGTADLGQVLLGLGSDCNVVGLLGTPKVQDTLDDIGLTPVDDLIRSARVASTVDNLPSFLGTLTRISEVVRDPGAFFGDLS